MASRPDPLTRGQAPQGHRQVGVDEEQAAVVERRAHAVAGVRRDQHPVARRGLRALDQRHAHAHPGPRRTGLDVRAVHEADLHRGVVADVLPGGKKSRGLGRRPGRAAAARRAGAASRSTASVRMRQAARSQISAPPLDSTPSTSSTLRPGRTTSADTSSRAIGTGREDLERDAREHAPRRARRRGRSRRPSSAHGGPACWLSGSHGPRVSSVAAKAVAVGDVEGPERAPDVVHPYAEPGP